MAYKVSTRKEFVPPTLRFLQGASVRPKKPRTHRAVKTTGSPRNYYLLIPAKSYFKISRSSSIFAHTLISKIPVSRLS